MKESSFENLDEQLETSRLEILQLAHRVRRLVARQNERQVAVQRWRESMTIPRLAEAIETPAIRFNLCSLCAAEKSAAAIDHVGGCAPGSKCNHCGQPAIMWIEFKNDGIQKSEHALLPA